LLNELPNEVPSKRAGIMQQAICRHFKSRLKWSQARTFGRAGEIWLENGAAIEGRLSIFKGGYKKPQLVGRPMLCRESRVKPCSPGSDTAVYRSGSKVISRVERVLQNKKTPHKKYKIRQQGAPHRLTNSSTEHPQTSRRYALPAIPRRFQSQAQGITILIPLSNESDYLLFLRNHQIEEVHWAGNPNAKGLAEIENTVLEPRASFQRWTEIVKGACKAWTLEEYQE
jgi:hypothetical protein